MKKKQGYLLVLLFSLSILFGLYKTKDSGVWLVSIVVAITFSGFLSVVINKFFKK